MRVGGVAWAQHTGIEKVEFRVDGGRLAAGRRSAGCPATTPGCSGPAASTSAAGSHSVAVRATDRSGYTQTAVRSDVVPDGATGWHTVDFTAG